MTGPDYLAAGLERALAEDPRTAELGITVTVLGERAHLRGEVASQDRRERVADVVRENAPGLTVVDELSVTPAPRPPQPHEREVLS